MIKHSKPLAFYAPELLSNYQISKIDIENMKKSNIWFAGTFLYTLLYGKECFLAENI